MSANDDVGRLPGLGSSSEGPGALPWGSTIPACSTWPSWATDRAVAMGLRDGEKSARIALHLVTERHSHPKEAVQIEKRASHKTQTAERNPRSTFCQCKESRVMGALRCSWSRSSWHDTLEPGVESLQTFRRRRSVMGIRDRRGVLPGYQMENPVSANSAMNETSCCGN